MNKADIIRKKLGIYGIDTQKKLIKYKKIKKKYTPVFITFFGIVMLLIVFKNINPDFIFWGLFISIIIYGELDKKLKIYEIGNLLEKDTVDIGRIKECLMIECTKSFSKQHKKFKNIKKVYKFMYILFYAGAIILAVTSVVNFDLRGLGVATWFSGINYMLYDAIKYRLKVYEIGMMIEEKSDMN